MVARGEAVKSHRREARGELDGDGELEFELTERC